MLKLYVLIRDDMSPAQQAVQAGHAVAQFGLEHPKEFKEWQEDNNTLIYLSVSNISWWKKVLTDGKFKHSVFSDSGVSINHPFPTLFGSDTAIAVAPNWTCQYILFKDLPLALRNIKSKKWWKR
jgi:hypothetical protein